MPRKQTRAPSGLDSSWSDRDFASAFNETDYASGRLLLSAFAEVIGSTTPRSLSTRSIRA